MVTTPLRLLGLLLGTCFQFIGSVAGNSAGTLEGTSTAFNIVTPDQILFNRLAITDINFFNTDSFGSGGNMKKLSGSNNPVKAIRESVANWYYVIRTVCIILLLCVLLYVGIRMAMSTIAEDKAKYKQMLIDWLVSMALLFVLHYIIIIVINVNNAFVDILYSARTKLFSDNFFNTYIISLLTKSINPFSATMSWAATVTYIGLIGLTFVFLIMYIKRMITIAFLILISPIITITYSIDRIGDGKSQALQTWTKEFMQSVLIQPFHCIIYLAFVSTAMSTLSYFGTIASAILVIMSLFFIFQAEKIIKKIFGIQAESSGNGLSSALAISAGFGALKKLSALRTVKAAASDMNTKQPSSGGTPTKGSNVAEQNMQNAEKNQEASRNNLNINNETNKQIDYSSIGINDKKIIDWNKNNYDDNTFKVEDKDRGGDKNENKSTSHIITNDKTDVDVNKANVKSNEKIEEKINNGAQNNETSNEPVKMPNVRDEHPDELAERIKRNAQSGWSTAKDWTKKITEAQIKSGAAGAVIGATLSGMAGKDDFGELMTAGFVGKEVDQLITGAAIEKVENAEQKWKRFQEERYIKENERTLAAAYNNLKYEKRNDRNYDIDQRTQEFLKMSNAEINNIGNVTERQYVQALHAMKDIYEKDNREDAHKTVLDTVEKIKNKEIKSRTTKQ